VDYNSDEHSFERRRCLVAAPRKRVAQPCLHMIKPSCVGLAGNVLSLPFVTHYTTLLLQHSFLHRGAIM